MKYTRYELKRKNNNFIVFLVFLITISFSFILGRALSKKVFVDNNKEPFKISSISEENNRNFYICDDLKNIPEGNNWVKYIVYILDNENNNLPKKTFKENFQGKECIFYSLINEKDTIETEKTLSKERVNFKKIYFSINIKEKTDKSLGEGIYAVLETLNHITEKGNSLYSKTLKKYIEEINFCDEKDINFEELVNFKEMIKKLPEKLTIEEEKNLYIYIINLFVRLSS